MATQRYSVEAVSRHTCVCRIQPCEASLPRSTILATTPSLATLHVSSVLSTLLARTSRARSLNTERRRKLRTHQQCCAWTALACGCQAWLALTELHRGQDNAMWAE